MSRTFRRRAGYGTAHRRRWNCQNRSSPCALRRVIQGNGASAAAQRNPQPYSWGGRAHDILRVRTAISQPRPSRPRSCGASRHGVGRASGMTWWPPLSRAWRQRSPATGPRQARGCRRETNETPGQASQRHARYASSGRHFRATPRKPAFSQVAPLDCSLQFLHLTVRQIPLFCLQVQVQKHNLRSGATPVVDHSCATTLAFASDCPADLPTPRRTMYDLTRSRTFFQKVLEFPVFAVGIGNDLSREDLRLYEFHVAIAD